MINIFGLEDELCRIDYIGEETEEPKQCLHSDYTLEIMAETYYQDSEVVAGNISFNEAEVLINGVEPDAVDLFMIVDECDPEQTGL